MALGRAIVVSSPGSVELAEEALDPNDVLVLPEGARTEWSIHEDLTKVFVIAERS